MSANRSLLWSVLGAAAFLAALWWIHIAAELLGSDFAWLGVTPRAPLGLVGVLTAPLIHGSFEHLFANTLPLLVLGSFLLYGYPRSRFWVLALIWLGSGLGVWLSARPGPHIGASGLAHGLMFFLFVAGILRRDRRAIALAMLTFFLYGSMIWGIFPTEPGVSFESHFWGAVMGLVAAVLFRRADPAPPRRRYRWEYEEGDEGAVGDLWRYARRPEAPVRHEDLLPRDEDEDSPRTLH